MATVVAQQARLPFAEAQAALSAGAAGPRRAAALGWHGTLLDEETGSFAIARTGGPFAGLVGSRVRVTHRRRGRAVYAFVHSEADLVEDISVTRRLFAELSLLADDDAPVYVQEIG